MFSALRRSGSARVASAVARSSAVRHASPPQSSQVLHLQLQPQTRTFLTSPRVTSYVMARAKLLHLAARTLLAYNQIMELDSAASPLSRYFAHSATLRDRVFMYLVCLIPPDQPIDLPDFLAGAKQAAHVVMRQIYAEEWAHNLGQASSSSLEDVATQQCIEKWAGKLDAQREALHLPEGTTFKLEKLEVDDARLVEAEYEYSDAAEDQKNDTCSMYHMNEAVNMKVRFAATEHLLAFTSDGDDQPTRHTLRSTFDWNFYSDVSRARLVDWRITNTTAFKLELPVGSSKVKSKVLTPT